LACQAAERAGDGPSQPVARPGAGLAAMARRLEGQVRESDLVGQFDDRTIVLACEGVATPEAAMALARRLASDAQDAPAPTPGGAGVLPAGEPRALSWGVAHTVVRVAPGVLLRQADTAAYQAAVTGRPVALAEC
jgi:PleD family two-component response regulator